MFTISAMGVTLIPHVAHLPVCYPFYPTWAIAYYACWYGVFMESMHLILRILEWHRLFLLYFALNQIKMCFYTCVFSS